MGMKEKDRIGVSTFISVLLFIVFGLLVYFVVDGFQTINPAAVALFAIIFGGVLIAGGAGLGAYCIIKKDSFKMEYAFTSLFFGCVLLLLKYSYFDAAGGWGKYFYAGIIITILLYLLVRIGYTVVKIVMK